MLRQLFAHDYGRHLGNPIDDVSLEVVVVEAVAYEEQGRGSVDGIVGASSVGVERNLVAESVFVAARCHDSPRTADRKVASVVLAVAAVPVEAAVRF